MTEYGKTENIFSRDSETHQLVREYRCVEFSQISHWLVTEKIDGTNIRLELMYGSDGWSSEVKGRSDNATLPKNFQEEALGHVDVHDALVTALGQLVPDRSDPCWAMTVYGEGCGPGIQKGSDYAFKKDLRIFDVVTYRVIQDSPTDLDGQDRTVWRRSKPLWRMWEDVELVARALDIDTVPVHAYAATTEAIIEDVTNGIESWAARARTGKGVPAEGVVARTDPYLYDYHGHRVMFKAKTRDLQKLRDNELQAVA